MNDSKDKLGSGMSVREAGQKGGEAVKKKYGVEFFTMIGRKGGQARRKTHGPEFYETIGQKGGQKRKVLVEEGKKAAAEAERKKS